MPSARDVDTASDTRVYKSSVNSNWGPVLGCHRVCLHHLLACLLLVLGLGIQISAAEFCIYLEQNFCLSDWDDCKQLVEELFTGMHVMAMEKFFIPTEICMQEPVCGGSPTFPPKPTDGPDA